MEALVMSPMFEGSGESQNLALDMAGKLKIHKSALKIIILMS